jgi:hypothetical protein
MYQEMGFFGNIWVRQNYLANAGESNGGGHFHHFDHVSLLTQGEVLVEVDGREPKKFVAPTFIVIKKDFRHKFTAITNDVIWYCVFALRDIDGNVTDFYSGDNNPYGSNDSSDHSIMIPIMQKTTHE